MLKWSLLHLQGRVDIVVRTDQRIWLFEFKVPRKGESTSEAMRQLIDRDYAEKYRKYKLPIHLVGIEINPDTRKIITFETKLDTETG